MKIAVATNNYKNVVGHVGMCKGFIVYEVSGGKILSRKEIENPFRKEDMRDGARRGWRHGNSGHSHHGNHGHHHNHDQLAEALNGSEVLLCKQAGWGLINSMNSRGIEVVFTEERFGDDAVLKYEKGELEFESPLN
jgi:predicted Fe-Mo cluster-binding NifX family protein